jgi:hypothetical protein
MMVLSPLPGLRIPIHLGPVTGVTGKSSVTPIGVQGSFLRSVASIALCSLMSLLVCVAAERLHAEEIIIDLSRGARDPLVDFVPPPSGSPDRVQFTSKGLLIQQSSDVPGRPTGVTGFKCTLAASGNFKIGLDVNIKKLIGPTDGWGHGLIFTVALDDPTTTTLKLNQIAYPNAKVHQSMAEISDRSQQRPFYKAGKEVKEGTLTIERRGSEAVFSIQPKGETAIEIARQPCPTSDIRSVEVWSTRVEKGNSPSDILVSKLTLQSDGFYSFKKPVLGWFTWWQGIVAAHVVAIFGLLLYRVRQNAISSRQENRR